jgi:hypothetical protein
MSLEVYEFKSKLFSNKTFTNKQINAFIYLIINNNLVAKFAICELKTDY